ncbi:hypothetical protein GZH53_12445 [Flavihumibacter sp. R14]|nr:hypothetical protein [Flavihumibacter soli]
MPKFQIPYLKLNYLTLVTLISALWGCASIQQPTGGPKDKQPPKVVKATPKNLSTNFSLKKIQIEFDEFIKLNSEYTEISISPAMEKMPVFKARKELLEIDFDEALDSNTTYTINFGKAVVDVNEGNIITNFTYVFSTGNLIDSLSISGTVKSSLTKEPLKDATVFILPVKRDSIFGKGKPNIFTSTDSAGNFTLRNLREDNYFLYALKEEAADRIYNSPAEEVGFHKDTIHLDKNISGLELSLFKQVPETFAVKDRKIENDGRIVFAYNKPLVNGSIDILSPAALNSKKVVELTAEKDSAFLWLPDLTFDSLTVSLSADKQPIDTVQISRSKRDTYTKPLIITDNLGSGNLKPGTDPLLILSRPTDLFDNSKFSLLEDSVAISGLQILKDSTSLRRFKLKYPWRPEREYILKLADGALTDIFGNKSKNYSRTFSLDSEENFGSIALTFTVPDTSKNYIVQWLNAENKVIRTDLIKKDTVINYMRYPTAKYNVRVVYDENKNGTWDTGSIKLRRQPEHIWKFDKVLTLRPNWDLEEKVVIPKDQ